jgi:hypothetical protein
MDPWAKKLDFQNQQKGLFKKGIVTNPAYEKEGYIFQF